uniref:SLC26A/SulP transporter domain-containing protein n=1 Tax=Globodera rostochiensis TaxID=31243 RepID=A0A914HZB4_GLORO
MPLEAAAVAKDNGEQRLLLQHQIGEDDAAESFCRCVSASQKPLKLDTLLKNSHNSTDYGAMRSLFEGFRKSAKIHPSSKNEASPSTAEELGCQFTISSTSSSGTNQPEKRSTSSPSNRPNNDQMSQDAEDGPEVLFNERCQHTHAHLYNAARPPMNQDEFDLRFAYRGPEQFSDEGDDLCRQTRKMLRHYYRPCTSPHAFLHFILRFIPILNWLPAYKWRQCLLADAIGGLTVGIMHVPQGIAYALLARLHPVVGLYTSFFPPLFYMLFGTSRHNSIGSFAVVSLMAGMAVEQFSSNDTFFSGGDENKVITTYFSDQKVSTLTKKVSTLI